MASLAYILSSNPRAVLNRVDWGTIIFFITMFITMDGVWRSGLLQKWLSHILLGKPESLVAEFLILTVISLLLSQVLSNVPFVKLFIDYLKSIGYTGEDVRAWLTIYAPFLFI
jgi:Na+/H+ antiporter NhaD/arsenite permease-like protein